MPNDCAIKNHILDLLRSRKIRMTPIDLVGDLHSQIPNLPRSALHKTIKAMVSEGDLVYTNHYSTTHLEINFNRPMLVSGRVTLCPAGFSSRKNENGITIKLRDGLSFGVGDHPTTRLCIQALDAALAGYENVTKLLKMTALDIGTGSAVLAMVAVGLGIGHAVGIDTDPLACNEARMNLELNGMTDRIAIRSKPLDADEKRVYDLMLANLRPPTLKTLFPLMKRFSKRNALWIVSGFRQEDEKRIEALLPSENIHVIWRSQEQGWMAMAVKFD